MKIFRNDQTTKRARGRLLYSLLGLMPKLKAKRKAVYKTMKTARLVSPDMVVIKRKPPTHTSNNDGIGLNRDLRYLIIQISGEAFLGPPHKPLLYGVTFSHSINTTV